MISGSKNRKTSGNLQFPENCTFPEVFHIFDPLKTIFAMDMYTFLESARQGAANETIKKTKSWKFFFDSLRGECNFSMAILVSKKCPNQKVAKVKIV